MYSIYYLTSSLDDRIYIGITNNPKRRFNQHISYSVNKSHFNGNWIRKTIQTGGEIKMNLILENLSQNLAIKLEIQLIEILKRILPDKITNTAQGGLGFSHKGVPHSEEHKKALEKAQPHKVRIPKEVLLDLYVNQKLSKKKIGEIFGCGATTIDRRLIEYNIDARTTPNYKVSYKIDKEIVIDMFLNQKMTISDIASKFDVGMSGIRYLLQREGIDTSMNKFSSKLDIELLNKRFIELKESGLKKMKIYEELALETGSSKTYLSKLKFTKHNL